MKPKVVFKNVYKEYSILKPNKNFLLDIYKSRKDRKTFFAVKDVSFEVYPGETIGIIGINGSGKSTISSLLAEVIEPTAGTIEIDGEPSLIAISVGLNNNLSGLENIHLKCMMHGMSEGKIKKVTSKIVEFADIGSFIDQPVKNYSSGMRSRLGFAISVHTDPDIIVVDEALSVGDETFYNKCMDKVNEFKENGKTIFFVSHSVTQMRKISDRVMWIHYGEMIEFGKAGKVLNQYKDYIKWYRELDEREQKKYKNNMFEQQIVRQRNNNKIKRTISKAERKNQFWFNLQMLIFSVLLIVMTILMVTDTSIRTGWNKTIEFIGIENSREISEEKEGTVERIPAVSIRENGYVIDSKVLMYKDLNLDKSKTLDIFAKVFVVEQQDDLYKIEFNNEEGYVKASSIGIKEVIQESNLSVEEFLPYTSEEFRGAYLYYLTFLGQDLTEVQSKIFHSQIIQGENGKKILTLPDSNIDYYLNQNNNIEAVQLELEHNLSNELIQQIKEVGIKNQEETKLYIETANYTFRIDLNNNKIVLMMKDEN